MTTSGDYKRGVVQAIVAGFFLSSAGIGMRLIESATALQVNFYRAFGLLLFAVVVLVVRSRGKPWKPLQETGWIGAVAGAPFALASLCIIFALANTTVANVMFIVSLAPFCTALLGWLFLRERVSVRTWIAIAIAVAGVLIMVNGGLSPEGWIGVAWAFGMALCYGLFTVTARFGKDRDMFPAVFWSGFFLTVGSGLTLGSFDIPTTDKLISLSLGIFQIGVGGFLLVAASKHVPAAQIVFLAMLEVVLSPVWVWLGVGEVPSTQSLIGGAVIMAAIAFLTLGVRKEAKAVQQQ
ncbi:MAG: DMT family transporter [Gammaproteobacteria bacterium]